MADHSSGIENFTIPSSLFDNHEVMSDYFIDGELGCDCTMAYPPSDSECPNCIFDPGTHRSANIYKEGGPYPFEDHTTCPFCGGEGRSIVPVSETIRLRVYFGGMELNAAIRQFGRSVQKFIDNPAGLIFVIGYMYDLPRFQRADSIIVVDQMTGVELRCKRAAECIPWGFRKSRYFACMLFRQ